MTTLGIDGASVAGIPDCAALYQIGYRFCFPRLCFGHARDKAAPKYVTRARDAGLSVPAGYAYLRTWEKPETQAELVAEIASEVDTPFVWIDVEPWKPPVNGVYPKPTDAPHL